jgi:hypothetical protein
MKIFFLESSTGAVVILKQVQDDKGGSFCFSASASTSLRGGSKSAATRTTRQSIFTVRWIAASVDFSPLFAAKKLHPRNDVVRTVNKQKMEIPAH